MGGEVYEIGKVYDVPCVLAELGNRQDWWPILGPWHEDAEHIGFTPKHYHLDQRFLTYHQRRRLARVGRDMLSQSTRKPLNDKYLFSVVVTDFDLGPTSKRMKCRQILEQPNDERYWLPWLETAYESATLNPGRICPHRGADLSTFEPDKDGCVTCPLHGLRWNCETGKLKRFTPALPTTP